jgi:hypothetical protein
MNKRCIESIKIPSSERKKEKTLHAKIGTPVVDNGIKVGLQEE